MGKIYTFKIRFFSLLLFLLTAQFSLANNGTVLVFAAEDSCYYSEYIVFSEALKSAGYNVDARTATGSPISFYMIPSGTTISATANTLSGSSYSDFTTQFQSNFGSVWNSSLDVIPQNGAVDGDILSVNDMDNYVGLLIVGGLGAKHYEINSTYTGHGAASAQQVQNAAEKLNALALNALENEKPVLAQCHGAGIPVHWRIPNTAGNGEEALGYSILKGQVAAGFPEPETATSYSALDVTHNYNDKVTISSAHSTFVNHQKGRSKIITTRDWYPQTVNAAAKSFINVLNTYPSQADLEKEIKVLLVHGGAIDASNCSAGNKANDVPCNYGGGANLPADYTNVQTLLASNGNDEFNFNVTDINLSGSLTFNLLAESECLTYMNGFDVVIFFKHWSTNVTEELQNAIKTYVDNGNGLVAMHHAMYNDRAGTLEKTILLEQVLGVSSERSTWSAQLANYNLYSTNQGAFISTYGITYPNASSAPGAWLNESPLSGSNLTHSEYLNFPIYEEIYNNMSFLPGQSFGDSVNQISPLFSNDASPDSQSHTAGFSKLFNPSQDQSVGRVVCLAAGERVESFSASHQNGQVIRNAVAWSALTSSGVVTSSNEVSIANMHVAYPNPVKDMLFIKGMVENGTIYSFSGQLLMNFSTNKIDLSTLTAGVYFVRINRERPQKIIKL